MRHKKTGGENTEWTTYDSPKPPPVKDIYEFWAKQPRELSARCQWWLRQIQRGWRPNRRWSRECRDCSAELYGVWIWEFENEICPALRNGRGADYEVPEPPAPFIGPLTQLDTFKHELTKQLFEALDLEMDKLLYGEGRG